MQFQLADLYEALCDAGPDAEVLVAPPNRRTRRQLDDRANQLAHHLEAAGVNSGDFVAIYSRNRIEYLEAMLACFKIAAVPVNLNYRYRQAELDHVLSDSNVVAAIVEREYEPNLDAYDQSFGPNSLKTVVVLEDGSTVEALHPNSLGYEEALAAQVTERGFANRRSPDDIYVIYTGGTTGQPKGVLWRHEDAFFGCFGGGNYYDPIKTPEAIAVNATQPGLPMSPLVTAPLMHGGGQWVTFIGIYSGGKSTIYTDTSFDARKVLTLAQEEQVTSLAVIGDAMGAPIAEIGREFDIPSLFNIGNGGAMMSPAVRARLQHAFPNVMITDGYGASETGSAATATDQGSGDSRGRKYNPNPNTTVVDENMTPLKPGSEQKGMLARKGHIPLGYHNDPEKTAATFKTDAQGVRWVLPGDLAMIEADGSIILFGRGSQVINSGGEKIHPEEVEGALRASDLVKDAVVVGVADPKWGQSVVAIVDPANAAASEADIIEHCKQQLASYKAPKRVIFGSVPRTVVGKADYKAALIQATEALTEADQATQ